MITGNVACFHCLREHGYSNYLSRDVVPIVIWQGNSLCWTHFELAGGMVNELPLPPGPPSTETVIKP